MPISTPMGNELSPGVGDSRRNWPAINAANAHAAAAHRRTGAIEDAAASVRRRPGLSPEGNFPFRIYIPDVSQLPLGWDLTQLWRTFMVRSGRVANIPCEGPCCDAYDVNPDDDYFPGGGPGSLPALVTPGVADWYFWIDMTPTNIYANWPGIPGAGVFQAQPFISNGAKPPGYTDPSTSDATWNNFPLPHPNYILIGSVSTNDSNGPNLTPAGPAVVRQLIRADIPFPPQKLFTNEACNPNVYRYFWASPKYGG